MWAWSQGTSTWHQQKQQQNTRFFSSVKKCLNFKENGQFSRRFLIHNHYEDRGHGLNDLLKPKNVSEAVKVRSKRKLSKSRKLFENRNIQETCVTKPWQIKRKSSNCVDCKRTFTTTKEILSCWIWKFDVKISIVVIVNESLPKIVQKLCRL